jgi:hypothetical protein
VYVHVPYENTGLLINMQQPHGRVLISHGLPERESTELVATLLRNTSNTMSNATVKSEDV